MIHKLMKKRLRQLEVLVTTISSSHTVQEIRTFVEMAHSRWEVSKLYPLVVVHPRQIRSWIFCFNCICMMTQHIIMICTPSFWQKTFWMLIRLGMGIFSTNLASKILTSRAYGNSARPVKILSFECSLPVFFELWFTGILWTLALSWYEIVSSVRIEITCWDHF